LGSGSDTAYAHSFHIDGTKLLGAGEGATVIPADISGGPQSGLIRARDFAQ
jgi:hypothetical protein